MGGSRGGNECYLGPLGHSNGQGSQSADLDGFISSARRVTGGYRTPRARNWTRRPLCSCTSGVSGALQDARRISATTSIAMGVSCQVDASRWHLNISWGLSMPRISRFVVEFDIDEKTWQAETSHQHALEEGSGATRHIVEPLVHRIECGSDIGKFVKVQHVTTIKLRHKGSATFLRGVAPCSLRDQYRWKRGIHLALQRALEKAGYCKLEKQGDRMVVTAKKPPYDAVCEAFWREMQIRSPGLRSKFSEVAQQPIIPASIINPNEYTGKSHGLGWSGD